MVIMGHRVTMIPGSLGRWVTKCDPVPCLAVTRKESNYAPIPVSHISVPAVFETIGSINQLGSEFIADLDRRTSVSLMTHGGPPWVISLSLAASLDGYLTL